MHFVPKKWCFFSFFAVCVYMCVCVCVLGAHWDYQGIYKTFKKHGFLFLKKTLLNDFLKKKKKL